MAEISVLVVDDSRSIREYLKELLAGWGYKVTACTDGVEAYGVLKSGKYFPILILDWIMPGINGVELCQIIRSTPSQKYQYIILLTGKDSIADLTEGFQAGVDDYLTKPVAEAELKARLDTATRFYIYEQQLKNKEYEVRVQVYHALTELAEKRDLETGTHLERIADLACQLGEAVGLNQETLAQLWHFAPMHDIGKVGIPDSILHLARKFSVDEFEIMKTHAAIGYEILKGKSTLEMAAEIAYSHHERWDGSGYPCKVRGRDIPLAGRIVSIVDVYDALRSRRPYKDAFTHEESMKIILADSGKAFDPLLVKKFIEIGENIKKIFDEINRKKAEPVSVLNG